ncbi:MAG TPA: hypothetical protein VMZ27_17795 [Candidatus Saccharimonadales bacterium]|nr:hypothetical protein [Candidatus Saccharimonadales bacterium]
MNASHTRREFLADVGRGMLMATIGTGLAHELGLASALGAEGPETLNFGPLESLVQFMQETPADKLISALASKLKSGTELRKLVAAGALANARTFGGEDYIGFHTFMAMAPALHMSRELPEPLQALPVFKVLYRNTNRIQERGGRTQEVLHVVKPATLAESRPGQELLREAVHRKNVDEAERTFASLSQISPEDALNHLLYTVQENTEVHRVVLPYRCWDLMGLVGKEQAHTFLRQSVRYCVRSETGMRSAVWDEPRSVLPKMLEQHKLLDKAPGTRIPDDKWIDQFSQTIFKSTGEQAADAAAGALAEGIAPAAIGEAISLAANQLVLRDMGRRPTEEIAGKPIGSVHGDSIGVHACDSANAWRNLARVSNTRNKYACLILGAYQVAVDRTNRGGDFLHWDALPLQRHIEGIKATEPEALLKEADEAIRGNLQARVAAIIHRYGELGHAPRPVFDLMLRYAVSEDGALHAEKYYRTVSEEFAVTRPVFRWRQLIALSRVTASEYGRPAAGVAEARAALKV